MNKSKITKNIGKLSGAVEILKISQSIDSTKLAVFLQKIIDDLDNAVQEDNPSNLIQETKPEVKKQPAVIAKPSGKKVLTEEQKARKAAYMKEYMKTYHQKKTADKTVNGSTQFIDKHKQKIVDNDRKESERIHSMIEFCSCPRQEKIIKGMGIPYKDKFFYSSRCLDEYVVNENTAENKTEIPVDDTGIINTI